MKTCTKCKVCKSLDNYRYHKNTKDRLNTHCKLCESEYLKTWRQNNIEKRKLQEHKQGIRFQGLDYNEYIDLFSKQNGVCAICLKVCKSGRRLAIDHCHTTNNIRGLLCMNCNRGLGHFQDSIILLENAIKYLLLKQ